MCFKSIFWFLKGTRYKVLIHGFNPRVLVKSLYSIIKMLNFLSFICCMLHPNPRFLIQNPGYWGYILKGTYLMGFIYFSNDYDTYNLCIFHYSYSKSNVNSSNLVINNCICGFFVIFPIPVILNLFAIWEFLFFLIIISDQWWSRAFRYEGWGYLRYL